MAPLAEQIIERAQRGEKPGTKERRHAVAFAMSTMPTITNGEMAEWFQVTERAIRMDKKYVREQKAATIKEDDIGLVIADIALTYDNQIRDIEKCKKASKLGGPVFLQCCKTIFDMQTKKVEALQNLGYYPKNLGNLTVEKFEYMSITSQDGSVEVRPMNMYDSKPVELEYSGEILEAEFTDVKAIAAPTNKQ